MHVPGECGGAAVAAELGRGETIGRKIGAQASFLPWDADGEQALAMHVAEVLDREARLAVVFRRARRQNAAAEGPRLVDEFGLERGEAECVGRKDRRIMHVACERIMHGFFI